MAEKKRKKASRMRAKKRTGKRKVKAVRKKRTAKTRRIVSKKSVKGKRGQRYSDKQQQALLDKYHELRKSGATAEKAVKKVGVSYLTLLKWEKKYGKKIKTKRGRPAGNGSSSKKTALKKALKRPGKKVAAKSDEGLALVTPSGFRIEGISPAELIKVLRAMK